MVVGTLAFLIGSLILYRLPEPPNPLWVFSLIPLIVAALRLPALRPPVALVAGFLWALVHAHFALDSRLPAELEGVVLSAEGRVASIPERTGRRLRFLFDVETIDGRAIDPLRVRVGWFDAPEAARAAERWRLQLKMKRPRGFMNPGGFDYEGWLFQQGIDATGYVRTGENLRLDEAPPWALDAVRQHLAEGIEEALEGEGRHAVLAALAVGHRGAIERESWRVFTATGTSHLIAISGLHVGLVAGFAFFIGRWLWALPGWTLLRLPAPMAGAWCALIAATGYAALAGFSIPTRRALIMVAVVMAAQLARRRVTPGRGLALALGAVLLVDPAASLSPGFWLSFGAVVVLLIGLAGAGRERGGLWRGWGRAQWLVFVGLAPLLLVWFGEFSLVAPAANLVAVPWVSLAVVPAAVGGALLLPLWEWGGTLLLQGANHAVAELWPLLEWLASHPWARWRGAVPTMAAVVVAGIGALWLVAPRGVPLRGLGALLLLPLVTYTPERPADGSFRFTLLDVGQGLSAVVETADHTLVYDAGPRFPGGFDTGWAVVAPYLAGRGIDRIDRLVVSHAAGDHAGGVASLLKEIPAEEVIGSGKGVDRPCLSGDGWRWDGVEFRLLHPETAVSGKRNDHSCVLQVRAEGGGVLLTGDLEAAGERALIRRWGDSIRSDLLQVPHHGSATSSTPGFIQRVAPRYALFPVGWRNRFGHPRLEVAERYRTAGATLLETAEEGAMIFRVGKEIEGPLSWRRNHAKLWHAPSVAE